MWITKKPTPRKRHRTPTLDCKDFRLLLAPCPGAEMPGVMLLRSLAWRAQAGRLMPLRVSGKADTAKCGR